MRGSPVIGATLAAAALAGCGGDHVTPTPPHPLGPPPAPRDFGPYHFAGPPVALYHRSVPDGDPAIDVYVRLDRALPPDGDGEIRADRTGFPTEGMTSASKDPRRHCYVQTIDAGFRARLRHPRIGMRLLVTLTIDASLHGPLASSGRISAVVTLRRARGPVTSPPRACL